jgi:hypothetical protein
MRTLLLMVAGAMVGVGLIAAACGSSTPGSAGASGAGGKAEACVPGTQTACACPGAAPGSKMGAQFCASDGSSFGPCEGCGTAAASSSSAGGGDAGGLGDAGEPADAGDGCASNPYPAGPYGLTQGAIVPNLSLLGFVDGATNHLTEQAFTLGEFYNPTGNEVFPACSALGAGTVKPKVLLIFIAAVWAEPANNEAMSILPAEYATFAPAGGQFVTILVDGPTFGVPATVQNLASWVTQYTVNYPSGVDPTLEGISPFPQNLVIDTRTMRVVADVDGEVSGGQTCGDDYTPCTTDADCQTCIGGVCGDGTACTTDAGCAGQTCTEDPFWVSYGALLGLDGG